jgi:replication initiation and membrane attachment protein DnaB
MTHVACGNKGKDCKKMYRQWLLNLVENYEGDDEAIFDHVLQSITAARGSMKRLEKLDSDMAQAEETAKLTVAKVQQRAEKAYKDAVDTRTKLQSECQHLQVPCVFCGFEPEEE